MSWRSGEIGNDSSYSKVPTGDYDNDDRGYGNGGNKNMRSLQLKREEQDTHLDILDNSVSRLGDISLSISKEIDMQNMMLNDLQEEVDDAKSNADALTKKTEEYVKKAGGWTNFCVIVILIVILVILTLLVLYT